MIKALWNFDALVIATMTWQDLKGRIRTPWVSTRPTTSHEIPRSLGLSWERLGKYETILEFVMLEVVFISPTRGPVVCISTKATQFGFVKFVNQGSPTLWRMKSPPSWFFTIMNLLYCNSREYRGRFVWAHTCIYMFAPKGQFRILRFWILVNICLTNVFRRYLPRRNEAS